MVKLNLEEIRAPHDSIKAAIPKVIGRGHLFHEFSMPRISYIQNSTIKIYIINMFYYFGIETSSGNLDTLIVERNSKAT